MSFCLELDSIALRIKRNWSMNTMAARLLESSIFPIRVRGTESKWSKWTDRPSNKKKIGIFIKSRSFFLFFLFSFSSFRHFDMHWMTGKGTQLLRKVEECDWNADFLDISRPLFSLSRVRSFHPRLNWIMRWRKWISANGIFVQIV